MKRFITNLFRPAFKLLGVPVHPITIIMFVSWLLGGVGAWTGYEWMVWIMAVVVILVVLFWLWVRFYPLRYDQMTDREKDYYDSIR